MKKQVVLFLKYFGLFLFFLALFSFMCSDLTYYDFIWNYGFSHAIKMGEIPYLDFNTISTPLYGFFMAIFLLIWDNFLMFLIAQAILCTFFAGLLFKYIGKKAWLLLLIMAFPLFKAFIGTYNFLALILLVILFIMEDSNKNDFLVGVILGLLILTKQSIGGIVLITNLLFIGNIRKILKRLIGVLIPSSIFIGYLLVTKSLNSFIDLCFLGLFDFSATNGNLFSSLGFLAVILLLVVILRYFKTKDVKCSYVIGSFFLAFPLFDYYHFSMFFTIFCLLFIKEIKFEENYLVKMSIILLGLTICFNILVRIDSYKHLSFSGFSKFEYFLMRDDQKERFQKLVKKYQENDSSIIVGDHAMMIDIITDRQISYFDMTLKGNYGYNGTEKMINKVERLTNVYFYIDVEKMKAAGDKTQLDYKLLSTIIKESKLIDKIDSYCVYYKK